MLKESKNKNILSSLAFLTILIAIPQVSSASAFSELVVFFVGEILNKLVILIIGLAIVYFLWGVAKYILHSDDAKAREEGRGMMIYGTIAIFVMVSIWGFVNLLDNTFRLDNDTIPRAENFIP